MREKKSVSSSSSPYHDCSSTPTPSSRVSAAVSGSHKETKPYSTPPRVPAAAVGLEEGEAEEAGEEDGAEPRADELLMCEFAGVFPCAGRPLPEFVLQTLFGWLRSSDLSALCASSKAASSPGEREICSSTWYHTRAGLFSMSLFCFSSP